MTMGKELLKDTLHNETNLLNFRGDVNMVGMFEDLLIEAGLNTLLKEDVSEEISTDSLLRFEHEFKTLLFHLQPNGKNDIKQIKRHLLHYFKRYDKKSNLLASLSMKAQKRVSH